MPTETSRSSYLNHAALTPPSASVRAAVEGALADFARRGASAFLDVVSQRRELKGRLAALLGGRAVDFALVPNTSSGLQAVAHALAWRPGDGVLLFEGEFPTNVIPWQQAAARQGLRLEWASLAPLGAPTGADWGEVEAALRRGVRLVCISAVQFQTGLRVPLEPLADLCERYGAELCVDGIQACGAVPLPLARIDYLASGGHKWLAAVEGAGILYVNPRRVHALRPQTAGWLSVESPVDFLFEDEAPLSYQKPLRAEASALEGGALCSLAYAALWASSAELAAVGGGEGVSATYRRVNALNDPLEAALLDLGFESARLPDEGRRSCILSVRPREGVSLRHSVTGWAAALAARGVSCATPAGWLRFSPHCYNTLEDIQVAIEALRDLSRSP